MERKWYIVDAKGKRLGRIATEIANILRGKNKPEFAPNQDMGDYVVVVNASQVEVSGRKSYKKVYRRHSGRPGYLKETTFETLRDTKPAMPIQKAVSGMLPNNRLKNDILKKLKVYSDSQHNHAAQNPQPLDFS